MQLRKSSWAKYLPLGVLLFMGLPAFLILQDQSKPELKVTVQSIPPDMILIPGKEGLPDFYMNKTEEPNINYLAYIKWLERVFIESYPEVVEWALPNKEAQQGHLSSNDPYLHEYFTHPAFSYYPVVGLSWHQIQDYLHWKSDRVNELILFKSGVYEDVFMYQMNEDNFNTEALICGQYEGRIKRPVREEGPNSWDDLLWEDGILLAGYRLPTEVEWVHAYQSHQAQYSKCNNSYPEKGTPAQVKAYFLSKFITPDSDPEYVEDFDLFPFKNRDFQNLEDYFEKPLQHAPVGHFQTRDDGILHLTDNVQEWVVDAFQPHFNPTITDPIEILEKSGFLVGPSSALPGRLPGYPYAEKDFLGKMCNFRFINTDENLSPVKLSRYVESNPYQEEMEVKDQSYKVEWIKSMIQQLDADGRIQSLENYRLSTPRQVPDDLQFLASDVPIEDIFEQSIPHLNRTYLIHRFLYLGDKDFRTYLRLELEWRQNKIQELTTIIAQKKEQAPERTIRGGTNQNPGNQRSKLQETKASFDVGFRCVMAVPKVPVRKGYKVKW